jgi:hypothetical protein
MGNFKRMGNFEDQTGEKNSTPSFNFVLNSMGNFKRMGNFEDQTVVKKRLVWLGEAA